MAKSVLGQSGRAVSRLALGCGNFGGVGSPRHLIGRGLDRKAALASMDEAVSLGINWFDTAHSYAGGASERFIGEWLAMQSEELRADVHIATKVGVVATDTGMSIDLSPRNIRDQLSGSLARLGVTRVDFCLSHGPDPSIPIEATLEGFADAIERGQVSHIGACNVDVEQLAAATEASSRLGLPRYEWVQNEYNLLNRRAEGALFEFCANAGIGYTAYSPVAGGLLSGKYHLGEPPAPDSRLALRPEGIEPSQGFFDRVAQLKREAARRNRSTGSLALAWVMSHPQVAAAICGPGRHAPHLGLAREALSIVLDVLERNEIGSWFESNS